jgi:predicted AAA+ superfamily ATPase
MIERRQYSALQSALAAFPVVGLVGARQVGKTTLAKQLAMGPGVDAVMLDLERPSDLAKLREPELYLEQHRDRLVILDEIQRLPDLFPILRALVDTDRRPGRFLLLGSASPDLIQGASESLAGRIRYLELDPLTQDEVDPSATMALWFRGGFPASFLAPDDAGSHEWREAFVRTYLERDIPGLGLRMPAAALDRFWRMLAHSHGQLWNGSDLAASLGLSVPTVRKYLDLLQDTFMARQLQPWHGNLGKRLVKRPRVYLRDSGLLHTLLGITNPDDLLGHPSAGASWEGFVVEQVLAGIPSTWQPFFYRTSNGAELDLVLVRPGKARPLGIEIKLSRAPAPSRGFWNAITDLEAQGLVICPCTERFPLGSGAFALPVQEASRLAQLGLG